MRFLRVAVLALVASLAMASMRPASASIGASVSVSFFYDSLAPHGEWISSAQFGYVWRPVRVYSGWRPYYDGQWVYTDFGWTFASDDPWGWATYHYGRWTFDPYYGWVWVPGYEWAPAWVVFHQGAGYVGWAPLPPNVSLNLVIGGGYRIDPRAYCFVEERNFVDRRIRRHVLSPERNARLVRTTANVTHFSRAGDRYVNRSLSTERIERSARQRIQRRRIVDVSDHERAQLRVERDRVAAFRPQVSRRATHPPRNVVGRDDARGGRIERESRRESPARVDRRAVEARPRVTRERDDREDRSRAESSRVSVRERTAVESRRPVSRERTAVESRRPVTRERTAVESRRPVSRERTAVESRRPATRERTAVESRRPVSRERTAVESRRPASRQSPAVDSRKPSSKERVEASSDQPARSKGKKPASKRDPKREADDKKPSRGSGRGS